MGSNGAMYQPGSDSKYYHSSIELGSFEKGSIKDISEGTAMFRRETRTRSVSQREQSERATSLPGG